MVESISGSEAINIIGKKLVEDFSIDKEPHYSVYKQVYENLIRSLDNTTRHKGVIIIGSIGVGKTMLMKVIQKLFKETERRFVWVNGYEFKDLLDDDYTVPEIKQMYGKSLRSDLYIDDVGMNGADYKKFGNSVNIISDILIERYELFLSEGFRTHLSSNLPTYLKDNPANLPTLEKIYGARVFDRIKEMCDLITIQGNSLRK